MLTGLPPLVNRQTRLLILGSFPSVSSLSAQQYYAHPRNQFWPILQEIYGDWPINTGADSYQINSEWLLSKGLGLWDVYASCERKGSLDQHIRQPQLNDFAALRRQCPALKAVAHNGAKSFHLAPHVRAALTAGGADEDAVVGSTAAVVSCLLPSSSPAHAALRFEKKVAAWQAVLAACGVL